MAFENTLAFPQGSMSLADMLGLDPAFGLDKPVDPTATAEDSAKKETKKPKEPSTFTDAQLAMLARLGNPQAGVQPMRAPAAPLARPQMLPMTQVQLPQMPAQGAVRPSLAQLIYGGR
jgi:hypothetical protein